MFEFKDDIFVLRHSIGDFGKLIEEEIKAKDEAIKHSKNVVQSNP